jgi:hypothetical protein
VAIDDLRHEDRIDVGWHITRISNVYSRCSKSYKGLPPNLLVFQNVQTP